MVSVREVLEAQGVAVIGASRDPSKPGAGLLKVLAETGFKGRVAGVNPQGGEVWGVPLYETLEKVPFPIDVAVLLIPPKAVAATVSNCARRGVKGVVISAEGFAETGDEGRKHQEEVRAVLRATGMRGFGPNTLGLINTSTGFTTSYLATPETMRPGVIGFAAQSGTFVGMLLRYLSTVEGLHISKGIGLGNKVDVDETEALEYLGQDDQTRIVGMYLEDVRDGRRFLRVARETVLRKPVLLLKGGRSAVGALATASHTASMAVDDAVLDGGLRQAGILRMGGIEELVATLTGFRCMPLPSGPRIAIVTYSGAQAIMTIDTAVALGLELARFSPRTQEKLSRVIPTPSKWRNPVDIFPDMMSRGFQKTTTEIVGALLEDQGVHGVVFISYAVSVDEIDPLIDVVRHCRTKPVFFSMLGARPDLDACRAELAKNSIPFYLFPETGVRVFAHMLRYAEQFRRSGCKAPDIAIGPEVPFKQKEVCSHG
jgi:acyl-CoA synthetase (NDP forming)